MGDRVNTNVLVGMKCPNCGSLEPFQIAVKCFAEVEDQGVSETVDFEWTETSWCRCVKCSFNGKVKDFTFKNKPGAGNKKGGKKRG